MSQGRQSPIFGYLEGSSKGQMVLFTPTPFDSLPEALRLGLSDQNPTIRRLAIAEAEDCLSDPDLCENVRIVLEKMQVDDEDREVRRRAAEALQSLAQAPEKELRLEDEKTIQEVEKQPEPENSQQPSSEKPHTEVNELPEKPPLIRKKPDWRWIAGITGATIVLFIIGWMGWKLWGPKSPGIESINQETRTVRTAQFLEDATATHLAQVSVVTKIETELPQSTTYVASPTAGSATLTAAAGAVSTYTADLSIPPACTDIGQTWTSPIDGMTLACVPAGEFNMGSDEGDDDENPVHLVYLDAFWIDRTEVTNAMFTRFVYETDYKTQAEVNGTGWSSTGSEWQEISGADWRHPNGPQTTIDGLEDHPVVQVSWEDARVYCQWAQQQLLSEAQWEKAARGTDGRTYPWGDQDPDCTLANSNNNATDKDCVSTTTPVGSYPSGASPYGALDMAGNLWEWVNDWYQSDYYSTSPYSNPPGPASGDTKVLRGGGWASVWGALRSSIRSLGNPDNRHIHIGFRCGVLPGE